MAEKREFKCFATEWASGLLLFKHINWLRKTRPKKWKQLITLISWKIVPQAQLAYTDTISIDGRSIQRHFKAAGEQHHFVLPLFSTAEFNVKRLWNIPYIPNKFFSTFFNYFRNLRGSLRNSHKKYSTVQNSPFLLKDIFLSLSLANLTASSWFISTFMMSTLFMLGIKNDHNAR